MSNLGGVVGETCRMAEVKPGKSRVHRNHQNFSTDFPVALSRSWTSHLLQHDSYSPLSSHLRVYRSSEGHEEEAGD